MLRLTAALDRALRLIGSGFGTEVRLIAAGRFGLSVGDQPTPETHGGTDQVKLTN